MYRKESTPWKQVFRLWGFSDVEEKGVLMIFALVKRKKKPIVDLKDRMVKTWIDLVFDIKF